MAKSRLIKMKKCTEGSLREKTQRCPYCGCKIHAIKEEFEKNYIAHITKCK